MTDRKSSASPPARTTEKQERIPDYVLRGLGILTISGEEILQSYRGGGRWLVPSGTNPDQHSEVRVGTRPERNTCQCSGFSSHKHCSHVVAAGRVAKKSAVCDGCGERRWDRELVEVMEDDESLTWFPGDRLCKACVLDHGGIA